MRFDIQPKHKKASQFAKYPLSWQIFMQILASGVFLSFSCHIHYNPLISEIWIDIENLWNVLGFQIWAAAQCEGLCAFVVLFILHTVCICLPVSVCTEFYCPPGLYSIKIKMIWFVPMQIVKLEKRRQ